MGRRVMGLFFLHCFVAFLVLLSSSTTQGVIQRCTNNLFTDPSVETSGASCANDVCNYPTFSANGWTGSDIDIVKSSRYPVADGTAAFDLNGNNPGYVQQTITVAGPTQKDLSFTFYAALNPESATGSASYKVDIYQASNGQTVQSSSTIDITLKADTADANSNYQQQALTFLDLSPGNYIVRVSGVSPGASGVFSDSFCVEASERAIQQCTANLLLDPSVEGVPCGSQYDFCYQPTYSGVGWTGTNVDVVEAPTYPAATGRYAIDLNGNTGNNNFQQTFTLPATSDLQLSFYAASNPSGNNPQYTVELTGPGAVPQSAPTTVAQKAVLGATNNGYVLQNISFRNIGPGSHTLILRGFPITTQSGVLVDSFCLTATPLPTGNDFFQNSFEASRCDFMPNFELELAQSGDFGIPSNDGSQYLRINYPSPVIFNPVSTNFGGSDCFRTFTSFSIETAVYLDSNHVATGIRDQQIGICASLSGQTNGECGESGSRQIIAISYDDTNSNTLRAAYSDATPIDTSPTNPDSQAFSGTGWFLLKETYSVVAGGGVTFTATLSLNGVVKATFAPRTVVTAANLPNTFGLYELSFCDTCSGSQTACSNAMTVNIDTVKKYRGTTAPLVCTPCSSGCCPTGCLGSNNCDLVRTSISTTTSPPRSSSGMVTTFGSDLAVKIDVNYETGNTSNLLGLDLIRAIECNVSFPDNLLSFSSSLSDSCYLFKPNQTLYANSSSALCSLPLLTSRMGLSRFGVYSTKLLFTQVGSTTSNNQMAGNITISCGTDKCSNMISPASSTSNLAFAFGNTVDQTTEGDCSESFSISRNGNTKLRIDDSGDLYGCPEDNGQLHDLCSLFSAIDL